MDVPDAYINSPIQEPGDGFFLQAFENLSSCRQIGMGPGPIPWNAVRDYAIEHQYPYPSDLWYLVRCMDAIYLEWTAKKKKDG